MSPSNAMKCLYKDEGPAPGRVAVLLASATRRNRLMVASKVVERITVYKVTCIADGRVYVGITVKAANGRWVQHAQQAESGRLSGPFHTAIKELGRSAFTVESIATAFSRRDAGAIEKILIAEYDCVAPKGFNLNHGGEPDARWSDLSKAKNSASHKGIPWTEAKREQMTKIMQTDDYRAKMRAASAKAVHGVATDETKAKISAAAKKQFSDPAQREIQRLKAVRLMSDSARRDALREKATDNWSDPDYRLKHKKAMTEKSQDAAYLEKHRKATTRRMANPETRKLWSERAKAQFQDPVFRAKYDEAILKRAFNANKKIKMDAALSIVDAGDEK